MKRAIIVLLIIAAIGAGAGAYYVRHSGTEINVMTSPVTRGDVIDAVAATGTLQAVISVNVGSQVSGQISWLGADFNSIVKKDQVIAKIDPTLFDAQVAQSTANLANAKAQLGKDQVNQNYTKLTLQRDQDLRTRGIISQDALDAAKTAADQAVAMVDLDRAQIQQAEAQLSQSKVNLEHTIITSPIDGIVTQRSVDVGQTVQASMTAPQLFVIAEDLTKMQVSASIDESDVGRLRPGQNVTFHVDAYPSDTFQGTLAQIRLNPVVVNNVTTYATMINVPNDDFRLKPGMTANLQVQVAKKSGVLRIPNAALRFRPNADMFAALNQAVPPEAIPGGRGGRGRGQGGANGAGGATGANGAGATGAARGNGAGGAGAPAASMQPGVNPGGTGGQGRGGANSGAGAASDMSSADRQARMMDRFKAMTPDEQKQFVARMKERGQDTTPFDQLMVAVKGAKSGSSAQPAFVFKPRYGSQNAETIDSLFAPLPNVESRGRVWLYIDHQLKPLSVRLGITDGTNTELLTSEMQENTEVVTGVTGMGAARTTAAGASGNPLMPNQRGGPGGAPGRGR